MRRRAVLPSMVFLALVACWVVTLSAAPGTGRAQTTAAVSKVQPFTDSASSVFTKLVTLAEGGFFFARGSSTVTESQARAFVEQMIAQYHLSEENRFQPPIGWGGIWTGKNASGFIVLKVIVGNALMKGNDTAEIGFMPPDEKPMSEALLSQLLAKGAKTRMADGDSLDLELPVESSPINSRCISWTTLNIRLTGALVVNTRNVSCQPPSVR